MVRPMGCNEWVVQRVDHRFLGSLSRPAGGHYSYLVFGAHSSEVPVGGAGAWLDCLERTLGPARCPPLSATRVMEFAEAQIHGLEHCG